VTEYQSTPFPRNVKDARAPTLLDAAMYPPDAEDGDRNAQRYVTLGEAMRALLTANPSTAIHMPVPDVDPLTPFTTITIVWRALLSPEYRRA
jgi:hypothetical protein